MPSNKIKLVLDLDDKGFIKAVSGDLKSMEALQRKLKQVGASGETSLKKLGKPLDALSTFKGLAIIGAVSAVAVGIGKAVTKSI